MAFPQVAATNSGNQPTDSLSHTINLPAGITAGDLLMVFYAIDGVSNFFSATGWTSLASNGGTSPLTGVRYKIATGAEGVSETWTTASSEQSAHVTYRITGWHGTTPPEISAVATGTSATPNPPSLNPTGWDVEDTLWLAVVAWDNGSTSVSSYSGSVPDNRLTDRAANTTGVGIAAGTSNSAVASLDPSSFTIAASEAWKAYTIAVRPGSAPPPDLGITDSVRVFNIGASADDQETQSSTNASYASVAYSTRDVSSNGIDIYRRLVGGLFSVGTGQLKWDTSAIPDDAEITAAYLRIHPTTVTNADSRNLVGEFYTWVGASTDWTKTAPATPILDAALSSISAGTQKDIPITDFSGISKTGYTLLRLQVSGDQPAGDNTLQFASSDNSALPGPRLIVEYTSDSEEAANGGKSVAVIPIAGPLDDGRVTRGSSSGEWPPTGPYTLNPTSSGIPVSKLFASVKELDISVARWDTSLLPDGATVSDAEIRLVPTSIGTTGRSVIGEWYDFIPPLADANWSSVESSTAFDAVAQTAFAAGVVKTIPLKTPATEIDVSGYTGMRLHLTGGDPGTTDYFVTIAAYENTTYAAPELVVYYTTTAPEDEPVASFTAEGEDLTVTFTDTSTDADGTITSWLWDFGDTTTSTLQDPVHTYGVPGTYTVTLTVTDDDGNTDSESTDFTVGDEVAYEALHDTLPFLPDLAWATGYSYRAQFRDVDLLEGPFSELVKFKTDTAPFAPKNLAPANGLVTPDGFLVCVVSDPDADDTISTVTYEIIDVATETLVTGYPKTATGPFPNNATVSFDANADLTLGNTYRWRAKASDGTLTSEWSVWAQFEYTMVPTAHMSAPVSPLINSVPSPSAEYIDAYVLENLDTDATLVRTLEEGPAFGSRVYELTKSGGDGISIVALDPDLAIAVPEDKDKAFLAVYARTVSGAMSAKLYLECFDNNGDLLDTLSPNTHTDGFDMVDYEVLTETWQQYGMFTDAMPVGTVTVRPVVEFDSASNGIAQLDAFQINFLAYVPPQAARVWYNYFDGDFSGYVPATYSWASLPGQSESTGVNVLSSREPTVYFDYEGLALKTKDRLYVQEWSGTKWVQIYDSNWTVSARTAIPIPAGKLKNQAAYRLKISLEDADTITNDTAWIPFEVRLLGPTEVVITTVGQDADTATLNIAWEPSQLAELEFIAYEVAIETARFGEKRVARITDPATTEYTYPYPISDLQHIIKVRQVKAEAGDELASRWSGGTLSVEYDKWFIKDIDRPTASYLAFDVISGDEPSIGHQANKTAFRPQGRRLPVHYLGEERSRTGSLTVRIGYVEDADTQLIRLEDLIEARRVCILGLNPSHKVFAVLEDPSEKLTDRPWIVAFDVPWQETEFEEDVFLREGR